MDKLDSIDDSLKKKDYPRTTILLLIFSNMAMFSFMMLMLRNARVDIAAADQRTVVVQAKFDSSNVTNIKSLTAVIAELKAKAEEVDNFVRDSRESDVEIKRKAIRNANGSKIVEAELKKINQ